MEEMYEKYGYYCEQTISIVMPGVSGLQRMKELMQELRDKPLTQIGTHKIDYTRDYMPAPAPAWQTASPSRWSLRVRT